MLSQALGISRSLLIYYAIPGRIRQMRRFYRPFIPPDALCFDIGAHVGNRILAWRGLGARVVAVEPQPQLMRLLRWFYGRSPHVTLIQQAVGATVGSATMHISSRHPTVTSLSAGWITAVQQQADFAHVRWDQQQTVPLTTLDALINEYGRPHFCKIDIEGYELAALQGLSTPIPALSFEYIPATLDLTTACIDYVAALGNYAFNFSLGETHRLAAPEWLSAAGITAVLATQLHSGDVYARLRG